MESRRRVWMTAVTAGVLLAGAGAALATRHDGAGPQTGRSLGSVVGGGGGPTPAFSITTGPTLPIPDPLPADPNEDTPAVVVGTIEIPALGLRTELQRGVSLTAINRGPAWWPGTAMPGELGNVVVAGHRTVYSKPFNRLDELSAGDQVIFTTDAGRFVYEVRGVIVVPADWIDIAAQSDAHTATLFACHPPGSATERIVAKLRLLGADGQPVDPDVALPPLDEEARHTEHTLLVRADPDAPGAAATDPFG